MAQFTIPKKGISEKGNSISQRDSLKSFPKINQTTKPMLLLCFFLLLKGFYTKDAKEFIFDKRANLLPAIFSSREKIVWEPCGDIFCSTMTVPMDPFSKEDQGLTVIALYKYSVNGGKRNKKILIVNPGGPAFSSTRFISSSGKDIAQLFDNKFDIIGFDPRGVGNSLRFLCLKVGEEERYSKPLKVFGAYFLPKDATKDQLSYYDAIVRLNAELCSKNSPSFSKYLASSYVVQDIEQIRKALGVRSISYWGMDYGAVLGLSYANQFPKNIHKLLLDSPINPEHYFQNAFQLILSTTRSTLPTLKAIATKCDQEESCPLHQKSKSLPYVDKNTLSLIYGLLDELRKEPAFIYDEKVTGIYFAEMLEELIFGSLSSISDWPEIFQSIKTALEGNFKPLFELSVAKQKFNLSNRSQKMAIVCPDGADLRKTTLEEWNNNILSIEKLHGFPARILGSQYLFCRHWARKIPEISRFKKWNNNIERNILVVGNALDPVSPLAGVKETIELIQKDGSNPNTVLLELKSIGHGLLADPTPCTLDYIKNYIIDGKMPQVGATCESGSRIFSSEPVPSNELVETAKRIHKNYMSLRDQ
jgi:pimeloyl-ACP methyl ester carboxylesterase